MIAVIKGDIIGSRKIVDQNRWLSPLKSLLEKEWQYQSPQQWEIVWGDTFQIEISKPEQVLLKALELKTLIKKTGIIDVRLAIGIGEKTYNAEKISESNGTAFIYAGEIFATLEKENKNILIKTPWADFDDEINRYLYLTSTFMDKWSVYSAELIEIILKKPTITQKEIGEKLGIKQNSVSGRWTRANADELLEVEKVFREKIKQKLQCL